MIIKGRVWKFKDNVNTDEIIAGKRLLSLDLDEISKYAFEAINPQFTVKAKPGDIIVAGDNFGCGSSREQAPKLKISAVVANYFARIFFRNALNIGLPLIEAEGVDEMISEGDIIEIQLSSGKIINQTTGNVIPFRKMPVFLTSILAEGGVVNYLKNNGEFIV